MKNYFNLYANCIMVEGKNGCVLLDLQRGEVFDIPQIFFEVYNEMKSLGLKIDELKLHYENKYNEGIDKFFSFLEEKGVGYISEKPFSQANLQTDYHYPGMLRTAVVRLNDEIQSKAIFPKLEQFFKLGLREIIIYTDKVDAGLSSLLKSFDMSPVKSIQIFLEEEVKNEVEVEALLDVQKRISRIITSNELSTENDRFFTLDQKSKVSFVVTMGQYCESLSYNTYSNKVVFLNNQLNLYSDQDFKIPFTADKPPIHWLSSKSKIEGCKDCKYRNICCDSVDVLQSGQNLYRKEKCELFPELFNQ